jgi:hypothetical protein
MKKRVTVLLGAGAMIEAAGVSTNSITNNVYEACKNYKLSSGEEILREFARDFALKQAKKMYNKEASFEDLFDILENFMDYNKHDYNDSASVILSSIKPKYDNVAGITWLYHDFLDAINETVYEYDKKCSDKGVWMKRFFNSLITKENCYLDVFTLNYDTWIEQFLGEDNYIDGFIDINQFSEIKNTYNGLMRFSPLHYLNAENMHTVSHLHGQICFGLHDLKPNDINAFHFEEQTYSLYKYKTFNGAQDFRNRSIRSHLNAQSGHTIFPANIITGRMKTDKMIWSPMQIYMYGFINALMRNEELIIIGYGFGDLYVNTLLYQYLQKHKEKKKVRLITYCSDEQFNEDVAAYHNLFHDAQCVYAQCIMEKQDWCSFRRQSLYKSEKTDACIYIDGFKKYCEDYISGKI